MQARIGVSACWKGGSSAGGRTDGDKGEFPSERESNDTGSNQGYDSRDNPEGLLGRTPSNSGSHVRSQGNTSKPADLLRVFTQTSRYGASLQKKISFDNH